jgi:hypothetical protein
MFGEGPGGFVLTGSRAELESLADGGVPATIIGETGGDEISIGAGDSRLTVSVEDAAEAWSSISARIG